MPFLILLLLAALTAWEFRGCGPRTYRICLPLRLARAPWEAAWAVLCGIRLRGFARRGTDRVLRTLVRRNLVFVFGRSVVLPWGIFGSLVGLAIFVDLPLHLAPAPESLSQEELSRFFAGCGEIFEADRVSYLAFLLAAALSLPLAWLSPWGTLGAIGLTFAAEYVVDSLLDLGLGFRIFSMGWFAGLFYGEQARCWWSGFLAHGCLILLAAGVLFLLARILDAPRRF